MTFDRALLLVQAAATAYMTGLIWFVQVVHYPLLHAVPPSDLPAYEARDQRRTGLVVGPPMLVELVTAVAAVRWRPPELPALWAWAGVTLLGVIWASTAFVQVPLHDALERAHDSGRIRLLVASNWFRTVGWTARALLLAWALTRLLRPG
ncbi:MAG TPA: hypothetical protein VMT11_07250 [Myxococcaceae bacterium]|nr:hypothetical protein [Myxococcaceae bacterium]